MGNPFDQIAKQICTQMHSLAGQFGKLAQVQAEKPAVAEAPDGAGQWFVDAHNPLWWYGPSQGIDESGTHWGHQCYEGLIPWKVHKTTLASGGVLPIPPRLSDAELADLGVRLTGEVRPWKKGDMWIDSTGFVAGPWRGDEQYMLGDDHAGCGWRRWIAEKIPAEQPAPPVLKPWPMPPVTVSDSPDGWMLVDGNEAEIQSREHYEAIAEALTRYWPLVAILDDDAKANPAQNIDGRADSWKRRRDALLAKCRDAGFQRPETTHETL